MTTPTPIIEMTDIAKSYARIRALEGVNLAVRAGEVTCVLGDNGAGKSTLIKIMAGLHPRDDGVMKVNGKEVRFNSPRDALNAGIATVYQDLAVVDLMETWRNFFLGSEVRKLIPVLKPLDIAHMRATTSEQLAKLGIHLADVNQPLGTLSGGQRQCVAIARAVYFGAKVLILDEPTAALGVKQSGVVLKYVRAVCEMFEGTIGLDPCSNGHSIVGAEFKYALPDQDGLHCSWDFKTIYVNPPYGADRTRGTTIKHWMRRCASAHEKHGAEVLALVPVATNTKHWKLHVFGAATGVAFLYDTRLKFLVDGQNGGKGAPMSCAMVYWGSQFSRFERVFLPFGAVLDIRGLRGKAMGISHSDAHTTLFTSGHGNCPQTEAV